MINEVLKSLEKDGVVFEQRLAGGGFAEVHRARVDGSPRAVRISKYPFEFQDSDDYEHKMKCQLVQRESALVDKIKEIKGLVNIFGIIKTEIKKVKVNGKIKSCLVTTLSLADCDLEKYWNEQNPGNDKLLKYFAHVAQALDFMHGLGYHHRDIKEKNILIFGEEDHARLGDFGLVKLVGATDNDHTGICTLRYAAPEVREKMMFHETQDQYSLAATYLSLKSKLKVEEARKLWSRRESIRAITTAEADVLFEALAENPNERPNMGMAAWVEKLRRAFKESHVPPKVRTVDISGRGNHTSITEAIRAAQSDDRIFVRRGLYTEPLVIDKRLEIVGDGEPGDVVIQSNGKTAVLFKADMGRLSNLTIRQLGAGNAAGVDIVQGCLELENCHVTSQGLACVMIHGGADPRLRKNRIHDARQAGVIVYDNGRGRLENNEICGHGRNGVEIHTGGAPVLSQNKISGCEHAGLYFYDGGDGTLVDNDIFDNKTNGIAVQGDSNPSVRENRIRECRDSGVYAFKGGRGKFEDNEISANKGNNVAVESSANPLFRRNIISSAMRSGIHILKEGRGVFEANEINDNARDGVEIAGKSSVVLRVNVIANNKHAGVYIHNPDVDRNKVSDNTESDCASSAERRPPELDTNTVSGNTESGIVVVDGADALVLGNKITNNGHQGIHIRNAGGVFEDNLLGGNQQGAWHIFHGINVRQARNREI